MTINAVLETAGIERSDAEVLLASVLSRDRTWILAHGADDLSEKHRSNAHDLFERRRRGEPVAYIVGGKEFFGRTFAVDHRVLIPRPSTEGLVEAAAAFLADSQNDRVQRSLEPGIAAYGERWGKAAFRHLVDVGTGSGCIAVTLACEFPDMRVIATDASAAALAVARANAARHGVSNRVDFREGELLEPLCEFAEPFFVIANPPYVPDRYELPLDVSFEPREAIFGGPEGLDLLLPLAQQARMHPACVGCMFECREDQLLALARALSSR